MFRIRDSKAGVISWAAIIRTPCRLNSPSLSVIPGRRPASGTFIKTPGPRRPRKAHASAAEPEQTKQRKEIVEPGQIGLTLVGFHIPPANHPDVYALQVASIILGAGESSRLKIRLKSVDPKTKRPLALDGGMEALVREHPGITIALGAYLDPAQADGVEAAIFDELATLGAKGPRADELRKAKNQVQSAFVFSLENVQGLAQAIGRSWILTGDPTSFVNDVDKIEKVTAADVKRVVKQYFAADKAPGDTNGQGVGGVWFLAQP